DSAITWTKEGPVINLTSCKGCMICVEECPTDAMSEEKEAS
ncbi:MAG: Pyruvate:ferredoxin oxidoreductase, delta subunit, partial [Candidatus Methanomarinus sp.]